MEAFPKTRHILFEPVSEFRKKIRKNYTALDYRLIEAAVTDEDRDVTLQVRKVVSQTEITHSSVVDGASENSETRVVTGTRLDTFTKANALVKPYLVKIDVDGNEMKILSGATETLKDASIVIVETPKGEFSERIAFLERQGFVLFDLVAPCYYDDSFWQCDSIFIRSELQRRHFKQLEQRFDPTAYVEFNEASLAVPDTTPAPSLDRSDGVVTNFFIVIPTKDSAEYLDQSLGSILLQAGDFELHVHVQDAASTDQTSGVVDRWRNWLQATDKKNITLTYDSRPDGGLYDGITQAFETFQPSDDTVMTWLGSDDVLMPGALATVKSVLTSCPQIKWLTGLGFAADYDGSNRSPSLFAHFTRYHLTRGNHDGRASCFVMQEGTFWRVSLWRAAGGVNPNYKRASDALLWMRFARLESLFALDFPLGRYSFRRGQLAEDKAAYYLELDEITKQQWSEPCNDLRSFKVTRTSGMHWTIEETTHSSTGAFVEPRRRHSMPKRLANSIQKRWRKAVRTSAWRRAGVT
jgi:FkbM family methyltransferase